MAVNTILLDFSLKCQEETPRMPLNCIEHAFQKILSKYLFGLSKIFDTKMSDGGHLILYSSERAVFSSVRIFPSGIITLNIEYYKGDSDEPLINYQSAGKLERELSSLLSTAQSHHLPPVKRGPLARYFPLSDERILEYDIDQLVFEEDSPYQKVQIVHSKTLGNMLVLDGLQNLSERDLVYTETLMLRGQENYSGKEIVILGGGDGALLYELLKEQPKHVLMLEIDNVVIEACKAHLRSCCGDVLDHMKGPNYEIILGDCIVELERLIAEGKKFDYVFGDLTDAPLSTCHQHTQTWDFIKLIINSSLCILKDDGKYMTHCCGTSSPQVIELYDKMLTDLNCPVLFSKSNAFVPSFLEDWVFYKLWKNMPR